MLRKEWRTRGAIRPAMAAVYECPVRQNFHGWPGRAQKVCFWLESKLWGVCCMLKNLGAQSWANPPGRISAVQASSAAYGKAHSPTPRLCSFGPLAVRTL